MTHGPAIRTSGAGFENNHGADIQSASGELSGSRACDAPARVLTVAMLVGGADERLEQRMRLHRLRFELGMELAAEKPGMVGDLADLDVRAVRASRR